MMCDIKTAVAGMILTAILTAGLLLAAWQMFGQDRPVQTDVEISLPGISTPLMEPLPDRPADEVEPQAQALDEPALPREGGFERAALADLDAAAIGPAPAPAPLDAIPALFASDSEADLLALERAAPVEPEPPLQMAQPQPQAPAGSAAVTAQEPASAAEAREEVRPSRADDMVDYSGLSQDLERVGNRLEQFNKRLLEALHKAEASSPEPKSDKASG